MRRWPPLATRILIILGVSLAVAGAVAGAYGARPYTVYTGTLQAGGGQSIALLVFSLSSNGDLLVEVYGARQVLYVGNLTGDPLSVLRALSVFNIRIGESDMRHDVRAGLITGHATINASPTILSALPRIAGLFDFNILEAERAGEGAYRVKATLKAASGVILLIIPGEGPVEYRIEYRLLGYDRLSPLEAGLIGAGLVAAGIALDVASRRKTVSAPTG